MRTVIRKGDAVPALLPGDALVWDADEGALENECLVVISVMERCFTGLLIRSEFMADLRNGPSFMADYPTDVVRSWYNYTLVRGEDR